jgi:hypothetical protein
MMMVIIIIIKIKQLYVNVIKKLVVGRLADKLATCLGTWEFITVSTKTHHKLMYSPTLIHFTPSSYFLKINFNIIFTSTRFCYIISNKVGGCRKGY